MANINSLMSNSASSTSNLYGTRNVLSGLASGMDTEAMIENSVTGYKTKITQLEQQQTKYQWKQDAYRGITDKMYDLTQKYTSYTSKTNLYSNAFFNNSISTTAVSKNADAASKVSATGRSSSDVQIYAAKAATAARYDVSADALGLNVVNNVTKGLSLTGDDGQGNISVGKLKGTMTLNYDGQSIDITFDETDTGIGSTNKTLADAITEKLKDVTINTKNGTAKASEVINVSMDSGGNISLSENTAVNKQGANPYISYIDSSLKSALGATDSPLYEGSSTKKYTLSNANGDFTGTSTVADYLSQKDITVTMDGVTKTFRLDLTAAGNNIKTAFENGFQSIGMSVDVTDEAGQWKFTPQNTTSNLSISAKDSKVSEMLGLGDGLSNYLNTKTSIKTLLNNVDFESTFQRTEETDTTITGRLKADGNYWTDATTGNRYEKLNDEYYRVNDKGEALYDLKINGKSVYVSENSSLESVLDAINSSDAGVTASYSKLTGKFVFTSKETGKNSNITFGNPLAKDLFQAKTSGLKLGDVLGDEWFDEDGKVTLYVASSTGSFNEKVAGLNKDDDVAQFLKAFNASTSRIQFADSSSVLSPNGKNSGDTFTGYNLAVKATTANHTDTWAGNYRISNTSTGEANTTMTLQQLVEKINNAGKTKGEDATITALVNDEAVTLTRSSNTFDMDGMTVTLNGSFNEDKLTDDLSTAAARQSAKAEAVSFSTSGGSDDLVKTITGFVDEYNALLKELYDAYATQPAEKSSSTHARYEPLTDDDKSGMSEKAIESYEAKAKQGILFGDSDLRAAYESMVRAISPGGTDGATLRNIGIETTYSNGVTQIKLNESKLRETLDKDPDSVRNAFTKSKEGGASSDGLMTSIKNTMERFGSTSIASPGILVKKAGNTHSSTSLLSNEMQKQLDNVQTQIEKWQTKMSAKIDYYTRQFTALEKLMNTMNSQSSALSGLMGGY